MVSLEQYLQIMDETKSSDMYITVDSPIMMRINGEIQGHGDTLDKSEVQELLYEMMDDEKRVEFKAQNEANFAIIRDDRRYRISAFIQRDLPAAVLRRIETNIPSIDELALPEIMKGLAMAKRGLVLVVGATGSGKSTSIAAMLNHRNENSAGHILTVEEPIEFVHKHKKCIVTQREIGLDTESYEVALKNSLRQAPDVIVIGEIRTQEAMEYAITFAETGHLCMASLHANNANQALERIMQLAPKGKKDQLLFDLSLNLKGVIAQQLIKDKNGQGRHGVFEILINTPRVADLIRLDELNDLKEAISRSKSSGMQTFDQGLFELIKEDKISVDEALQYADSANDLRIMLKSLPNMLENTGSLSGVKLNMD